MPAHKPAFRLTPEKVDELAIHEACAKFLDTCLKLPARWTSLNMGHADLSAAQVARLLRVGCKPAWPDILILFAGLVFGVEIKSDDGRLSITRLVRNKRGVVRQQLGQRENFPTLQAAGMTIAIVRSVDQLAATLSLWGIPHSGRPSRYIAPEVLPAPRGGQEQPDVAPQSMHVEQVPLRTMLAE